MISQRKILASVLLATMLASVAIAQDWTPTLAPLFSWGCLAASGDGRTLFAGSDRLIYSSTNYGDTWTSTSAPVNNWDSLACSVDGSVVIASANAGVYVSTNSGIGWVLSLSNLYGAPVACSADGKRMVVAKH